MSIRVEAVQDANHSEYQHFVRNCAQAVVQQTSQWSNVIAAVGQDRPAHLLARDESGAVVGVLPAFVFECELGNLLISSPQAGGYGGVAVEEGPWKEAVYQALLEEFVVTARRNACVLATVATPPFFGDVALYRKYLQPDYERENFYQYLDLRTDFVAKVEGEKTYNIRRNLRRNIKTAVDAGLTVSFDDTDQHFARWYDIHEQRMAELNARALPRTLFEASRKNLFADGLGFFAYVLDGSDVVAGALFVGLNQVLDIFMMSADSGYWEKHPNSLLVFETLKYAKAKDYTFYNWQSSSSRESSVYHYKLGWGSREGLHYYLTRRIGDTGPLERTPLETVIKRYAWHYVMPYDRWQTAEVNVEGADVPRTDA